MARVYDFFRRLLRFKRRVCIDTFLFRLHYVWTVVFLALFFNMLSYQQFFCEPMECTVNKTDGKEVDVHCWRNSTYTVTHKVQWVDGVEVSHSEETTGGSGDDDTNPHYRCVCFLLIFQVLQFSLPQLIWKMWEGGRMKMLVEDGHTPAVGTEERNAKKNRLVQYFLSNLHKRNSYAYVFLACEVFNAVNAFVNAYVLDRLLGVVFITNVHDLLKPTGHVPEQGSGATSRVFPRIITCPYNLLGFPLLKLNGLAIYREDYLYALIYGCLSFWFASLYLLSGVAILLSLSVMRGTPIWNAAMLRTRSWQVVGADAVVVCRACNIGDWFLLYQLAGNLDRQFYKELLAELAARLADN